MNNRYADRDKIHNLRNSSQISIHDIRKLIQPQEVLVAFMLYGSIPCSTIQFMPVSWVLMSYSTHQWFSKWSPGSRRVRLFLKLGYTMSSLLQKLPVDWQFSFISSKSSRNETPWSSAPGNLGKECAVVTVSDWARYYSSALSIFHEMHLFNQ